MKWFLILALTFAAGLAQAQELGECDWRASAYNIAEPWEENTRLFSDGKVRLALLDTLEPAAAAFHLLIISPPYNEMGEPQCRVLSHSGTLGWAALHFNELEAGYDPKAGLTFILPGMIYLPEHGFSNSFLLGLTLNQATGEILTQVQLGHE